MKVCLGKHRRHSWYRDREAIAPGGDRALTVVSQERFCWRLCGARQARVVDGKKKGPWLDLSPESQALAERLLYRGRVGRPRRKAD